MAHLLTANVSCSAMCVFSWHLHGLAHWKRATANTHAHKQIDDGLCTCFPADTLIHLLQLFILATSLFAHGTVLNVLGSTVMEFHGLAMRDCDTPLADSGSSAGYYCTVTLLTNLKALLMCMLSLAGVVNTQKHHVLHR